MQFPHRRAAAAPPEDARILAGPQTGRQQFVGDVVVDLVQLVPGGAAHHAVAGQAEVGLEPLHRRRGRRTEPAIHGEVVQSGIDGVGDLEPELHEPHVLAAGPLPQSRAGVGVGGAVVRLDAPELVVDGVPGLTAHHAVHGQAVPPLEGPHCAGRGRAVAAVHRKGRESRFVLRQRIQPELHLLHRAAGGTGAQGRAAPAAVRQGAAGGLALAGQFGKVLDRHVDIADLIPGLPPHHAVGGQVELPLERLDCGRHAGAEDAVHGQLAEEGVILRDAVQLPLQREHRRAGIALPQRRAGVALRDGLDVVGPDDLDVAAVVVFQDLKRCFALLCQRDRAPLLQARTGDGLAVAVFGVIGIDRSGLPEIGIEDVVRQPDHDIEHGPPVDVILVVAGGVGDVEAVAPAGVPLGVDAVQRQRDLAVDVRPQGALRPGRVDFAGRHVGDIPAERDGHVPGRGRRFAQMDRDVLRDDDPVQHTGRARIGRRSAAAPAARKQRVGRDDDGRVLHVPALLRFGDHLRLGQRHLPRKDLDSLDADGAVPRLRGRQAAHRIGQTGGIVLLQ